MTTAEADTWHTHLCVCVCSALLVDELRVTKAEADTWQPYANDVELGKGFRLQALGFRQTHGNDIERSKGKKSMSSYICDVS